MKRIIYSTSGYFTFCLLACLSILGCFILVACNGNKDKEENAVSEYSSAPAAGTDSTAVAQGDNTTAKADATLPVDSFIENRKLPKSVKATPNPAKKGRKGRTSVIYAGTTPRSVYNADREGVYDYAEVMPSFPGGQKALEKYIEDNIVYPQDAIDDGVEGVVYVVFQVDESGRVYTPRLKYDKVGYGLDEEALSVVNKMPRWKAGSIKGKNVKTRFELPINYQLF